MADGGKCHRERVASWAWDTDRFCQLCLASGGWSHGNPANGRGRDPSVLGRSAQSPSHPCPPAPQPQGTEEGAGQGQTAGEGGARAGGGGGKRAGREVGGWGGRKRKKIFSVSPPAESVCGLGENVSDILGRSRGRAGSERPRDSPSLEPVHPPPRAPHYGEPLTLRRSNLATAGRRDLGAPRPPFLLPSPPGESDWEAVSPAPMPGSFSEVGWGGGGKEDASSVPSRLVRLSERFEGGFLPQLGGQP